MAEEKLCDGKTFKKVMEEVNFHISDKEKIAQLNRDKTELVNSVTELTNKVTELEKQIEKMKNVLNCKHSMNCTKWVKKYIKSNEIKCCKHCDKWELAE